MARTQQDRINENATNIELISNDMKHLATKEDLSLMQSKTTDLFKELQYDIKSLITQMREVMETRNNTNKRVAALENKQSIMYGQTQDVKDRVTVIETELDKMKKDRFYSLTRDKPFVIMSLVAFLFFIIIIIPEIFRSERLKIIFDFLR